MTDRHKFIVRLLADFLSGIGAVFALVFASHDASGRSLVAVPIILIGTASGAGYFEPFAKRVWIHALVMMCIELIALPCMLLTCHSFECGGMIAALVIENLAIPVLVGLSYAAFFMRRRIDRPSST